MFKGGISINSIIKKIVDHRNITVLTGLILLMIINSFYVLWQIDRHEKALLGQEWLNPVPYQEWKSYENRQTEYEKSLKFYKENNQNLISLISEVNSKIKSKKPTNLDDFIDSLPYFENTGFDMTKTAQKEFSIQYPNEYSTWKSIDYDLKLKKPSSIPKPSNPPRAVIQQKISSYNRYLIASNSILCISLITFLVAYRKSR